jgi:hypothetical protein
VAEELEGRAAGLVARASGAGIGAIGLSLTRAALWGLELAKGDARPSSSAEATAFESTVALAAATGRALRVAIGE